MRVTRIILAGIAALTLACSPTVDFERMREQQRVDAFSTSPVFADRASMRVPPKGTVPIPLSTSSKRTGQGAHDFEVFCAGCHGATGHEQSVMASNMPGPSSPPLDAPELVARTDDELLAIVSHGRNRMPGFDWALPEVERRQVVAYIRELQRTTGGGATGSRP